MVERAKNEKRAKELEKLDRKKYKDKNERPEDEINEENDEEVEEEIVEEVEEVLEKGLEKGLPEINEEEGQNVDEMDFEACSSEPSVPQNE